MMKKMYKVRGWKIWAYTLEDCDVCHSLISKLNAENIEFRNINISGHSLLGDKIEGMYRCYTYPIIIIENIKNNQQIVWLPETSLLPSQHIRIYHSISELINNIKQIIK
jgi:glutaredoxin